MRSLFVLFVTFLLLNCRAEVQQTADPLSAALHSGNAAIKRVMDSLNPYEVQILFTRISRTGDSVLFKDYSFQLDKEHYFYPASTVKFPIAALALEKLNETDSLDRNTRYFVEGDTLVSSFAGDILRIFTISDNDANNRLFEFLGQDAINARLERKGIRPVRIAHRLGIHSDELATKPLLIYLNDSTTAPTRPIINKPPEPLALDKIEKGSGYYEEGSLIMEPFDFSLKNYYPVEAQHAVLKRIIFPGNFTSGERFNLNEEQRSFLLDAMQTLPRNAGFDENEFYDSYCKFFMYGDQRQHIPSHIKIYNKVGFAYGTLTDCAYIHDLETGVEFMLTATILVNKDGIFNDDQYEYEEIGIPFLAQLGRELYTIELNQKK